MVLLICVCMRYVVYVYVNIMGSDSICVERHDTYNIIYSLFFFFALFLDERADHRRVHIHIIFSRCFTYLSACVCGEKIVAFVCIENRSTYLLYFFSSLLAQYSLQPNYLVSSWVVSINTMIAKSSRLNTLILCILMVMVDAHAHIL